MKRKTPLIKLRGVILLLQKTKLRTYFGALKVTRTGIEPMIPP